jgi:vitamin B12 transporter
MEVKGVISVVLILISQLVNAQSDTSMYIPQVEVTAISLKDVSIGSSNHEWKNEDVGITNLSDFLTRKGIVYIKSYGPNTLSTLSSRGGSPGQTLILWNNLPIVSPTLGLLDASLINTESIDQINFDEGGNSTMWGSGAISGVLGLSNVMPSQDNIRIGSSIGSFNTKNNSFGFQLSRDKWTNDTRLILQSATNDFSIKLPTLQIDRKQTNAAMSAINLTQSFTYVPKLNHLLKFNYWYINAERQLPPTIVQSESKANQFDLSHRFAIEYKIVNKTSIFKTNFGMFDEINNYDDRSNNDLSKNKFQSTIVDFTIDKIVAKHQKIMLGTSLINVQATTKGYAAAKIENRIAAYISHKLSLDKFILHSGLRIEKSNNLWSPLVPSISGEYLLKKHLILKSRVSRNFRFPTLNDRYWSPGGNLDLVPEQGWNQELGLDYEKSKLNYKINYNLTIYNRVIDNWIQWGRLKNDLFFSALNLTKVRSRGISQTLGSTYKNKSIIIQYNTIYHYLLSTHQKTSSLPKIEIGDQLWYVPKHNLTLDFNLEYKSTAIHIDHHFFSSSTGINENVEPYNFGNIILSYDLSYKKSTFKTFFKINNYMNKNYFVIERRPMAGRYLEVGFNAKFTKNKK